MIQYQKLTNEYLDKAKAFCAVKEIAFPFQAEVVFIAINEMDSVIGICGVKKVYQIEPLASDQPLPAMILAEKAMAVIGLTENREAVALVKDSKESFIIQLEKYGFVVTDKSMTILKKEV